MRNEERVVVDHIVLGVCGSEAARCRLWTVSTLVEVSKKVDTHGCGVRRYKVGGGSGSQWQGLHGWVHTGYSRVKPHDRRPASAHCKSHSRPAAQHPIHQIIPPHPIPVGGRTGTSERHGSFFILLTAVLALSHSQSFRIFYPIYLSKPVRFNQPPSLIRAFCALFDSNLIAQPWSVRVARQPIRSPGYLAHLNLFRYDPFFLCSCVCQVALYPFAAMDSLGPHAQRDYPTLAICPTVVFPTYTA